MRAAIAISVMFVTIGLVCEAQAGKRLKGDRSFFKKYVEGKAWNVDRGGWENIQRYKVSGKILARLKDDVLILDSMTAVAEWTEEKRVFETTICAVKVDKSNKWRIGASYRSGFTFLLPEKGGIKYQSAAVSFYKPVKTITYKQFRVACARLAKSSDLQQLLESFATSEEMTRMMAAAAEKRKQARHTK